MSPEPLLQLFIMETFGNRHITFVNFGHQGVEKLHHVQANACTNSRTKTTGNSGNQVHSATKCTRKQDSYQSHFTVAADFAAYSSHPVQEAVLSNTVSQIPLC